ncbi:major facilitator superfamily domain-containing protein 9 [Nematostella vectensis]|uniref:major facilitator superfamily domain-containing protein 9 n=1 Tax=Nematostella vectensis TaxID=45351 RepID=UPI002076F545|nr:major facilitator superfamily domain-containing protein 9 [Nematostella vectensis]
MASSQVSIRTEKFTINCLYLLGFLDLMTVSMGLPLAARRARELGATPSIVGLIGSVYGAIQFFSNPLVGKFSDVAGRKKVLLVSLLGTGAAYLLHGLSVSLIMLALTRIPIGLFKQSQSLCKACLADITAPAQRISVFGKFNAFSSLGFVVGPLIGGHLAMTDNGFFRVFLLEGILFVAMTIFTWLCIEHDDQQQSSPNKDVGTASESSEFDGARNSEIQTKSGRKLQENLKIASDLKQQPDKHAKKGFIAKWISYFRVASFSNVLDLLIVRFLMGFSMIIFRSNFSTVLEFRYNTTPKTNGYVMSFNGIVGGLSGYFVGNLLTFYNNDDAKALLHFSSILAISIFCVTFSPELWVLVVFIAPLAFSSAVSRVCSTNLTLKRGRADEKGLLLGVGNSLMSFARMLSPTLGGLAQELSVYAPGMLSVSVSAVGILLMATRIVGAEASEEKKKD